MHAEVKLSTIDPLRRGGNNMAEVGELLIYLPGIVGLGGFIYFLYTPSMSLEVQIISNGLEYLKVTKSHHIGNIQYLVVPKFVYEELHPSLRETEVADNLINKVRVVTQEQLDEVLRNERMTKLEREVQYRKEMQEYLSNKHKQEKK